ncbi:uncharacterized protein LOC132059889 isoform X2 [Lycium ferocissimum]|uniref:uncharacterized protein LOC132059889 isoform X2 n=1 Tax=Lycium ferocissimum TaxID=112874 RepID=UPI0028166C41|nr:uncharacterized protein LOC132059889 isoform X2 [Lycium ferocissimum]
MDRKMTGGRGKHGKGVVTNMAMAKKGVPQSGDVRKTRNVNVLQGIVPFNLLRKVTPESTPVGSTSNATTNPLSSTKSLWADQVEEETIDKSDCDPETSTRPHI